MKIEIMFFQNFTRLLQMWFGESGVQSSTTMKEAKDKTTKEENKIVSKSLGELATLQQKDVKKQSKISPDSTKLVSGSVVSTVSSSKKDAATILGNLERKNKTLRRMLSWTVLEKKGYIVELVGEIHEGSIHENDIELPDILNYLDGVNLTDVIIECDTDLRTNRGRHHITRSCVDDEFKLQKGIQEKKLPIRYHYGDFRAELPARIGFNSYFLFNLAGKLLKNPEVNKPVLAHLLSYLIQQSRAYCYQEASPKQFNQMYKRLRVLNASRANEIKQNMERSEKELKARLYKTFKTEVKKLKEQQRDIKLEKEILQSLFDPMDSLRASAFQYHRSIRRFLDLWIEIQRNYMDRYAIYRLERLIAIRKKADAAESKRVREESKKIKSTTFMIVGNNHAKNIRKILLQLNWKILSGRDLTNPPDLAT